MAIGGIEAMNLPRDPEILAGASLQVWEAMALPEASWEQAVTYSVLTLDLRGAQHHTQGVLTGTGAEVIIL